MIQVTIHTPDAERDLGTPPEFRDFDGTLEIETFPTHYAAAMWLLERTPLADLLDFDIKLQAIKRKVRGRAWRDRAADQPVFAELGGEG